jgi:hypothetical protein
VAKQYQVDLWDAGARLTQLWAEGIRGKALIDEIRPMAEAWAERVGKAVPDDSAIYMACRRYMKNDPVDRRTKQARAQGAVVAVAEEAAAQIVRGQMDAFANISKFVDRLNAEVDQLRELKELDEFGNTVVPSVATYVGALGVISKEMRGWTGLFVEIRDRLAQHEEYEKAYQTILGAVRAVCSPDQIQAIAERLRADPAVAAVLRGMGGGGGDGVRH